MAHAAIARTAQQLCENLQQLEPTRPEVLFAWKLLADATKELERQAQRTRGER